MIDASYTGNEKPPTAGLRDLPIQEGLFAAR
jgi:hypothetical protein